MLVLSFEQKGSRVLQKENRVLPAGWARELAGLRANSMRTIWGDAHIRQLERGQDFTGLYICPHLFVCMFVYA